MLTKADRKVVEALARVTKSQDGEVLLQYLSTELQQTTDSLILASGELVGRLQGRSAFAQELIKLLRQAPEIVSKSST